MKKIWTWIVGVVVVAGLGLYFVLGGSNSQSVPPVATNPDTNPDTTGNPVTTPTPTTTPVVTTGTGGGTKTTGQYKNGTYTGPVSDAIYGKLQIVATISGGKLTNVTWPVYPNDPGHTSEVSASALPQLAQEAISSQSANVNVVSGATQTSEAFQQSLAAALAQAKA